MQFLEVKSDTSYFCHLKMVNNFRQCMMKCQITATVFMAIFGIFQLSSYTSQRSWWLQADFYNYLVTACWTTSTLYHLVASSWWLLKLIFVALYMILANLVISTHTMHVLHVFSVRSCECINLIGQWKETEQSMSLQPVKISWMCFNQKLNICALF